MSLPHWTGYWDSWRANPTSARTRRLREAMGDDTDDIDLDLDPDNGGNGGGDDDHMRHLSRAAASIFSNRSLSAEEKLAKLKLLLKVTDSGDDGAGSDTEPVPPEATGVEEA